MKIGKRYVTVKARTSNLKNGEEKEEKNTEKVKGNTFVSGSTLEKLENERVRMKYLENHEKKKNKKLEGYL